MELIKHLIAAILAAIIIFSIVALLMFIITEKFIKKTKKAEFYNYYKIPIASVWKHDKINKSYHFKQFEQLNDITEYFNGYTNSEIVSMNYNESNRTHDVYFYSGIESNKYPIKAHMENSDKAR